METQEIRITAHLCLDVPIDLSKQELEELFNGSPIEVNRNDGGGYYPSLLEIIDIELEEELYNEIN